MTTTSHPQNPTERPAKRRTRHRVLMLAFLAATVLATLGPAHTAGADILTTSPRYSDGRMFENRGFGSMTCDYSTTPGRSSFTIRYHGLVAQKNYGDPTVGATLKVQAWFRMDGGAWRYAGESPWVKLQEPAVGTARTTTVYSRTWTWQRPASTLHRWQVAFKVSTLWPYENGAPTLSLIHI